MDPDAPFEEAELYEEILRIQALSMKFMQKQFAKLDLGPHSVDQGVFSTNTKKIDNLFEK